MLRCMRAFSPIVLPQPRIEVARYTAVMQLFVSLADEYINVVEAVHQSVSPAV